MGRQDFNSNNRYANASSGCLMALLMLPVTLLRALVHR